MVSKALKWVAKHNIRVVIKSTGHNLAGRSTGYASLSIWTHHMRGIEFHDDWKADRCPSAAPSGQMAATIAAGMNDLDVLAAAEEHGKVVVAGSNPSVGIMGWFTGGGHGPLSSTYGMGADNLLQATVVTPTGEVVTANACSHQELFFALRGGGGGTFGVITEAVMKAFPTPQTTLMSFDIYFVGLNTPEAAKRWWRLMADIHADLPRLKDGGAQGYYGITAPPIAPVMSMFGAFFHYDTANETIWALYESLMRRLDKEKDLVTHSFETYSAPSFFPIWYAAAQGVETVATGNAGMGSRLLTRRALTEDVELVAKTFEEIGPKIAPGEVSASRFN